MLVKKPTWMISSLLLRPGEAQASCSGVDPSSVASSNLPSQRIRSSHMSGLSCTTAVCRAEYLGVCSKIKARRMSWRRLCFHNICQPSNIPSLQNSFLELFFILDKNHISPTFFIFLFVILSISSVNLIIYLFPWISNCFSYIVFSFFLSLPHSGFFLNKTVKNYTINNHL